MARVAENVNGGYGRNVSPHAGLTPAVYGPA